MNELIYGISAPHVKHPMTSERLMGMLLISLIFPGVFGIWHFGLSAAILIAVTTASTMLFALVLEKVLKIQSKMTDGRTILMGVLLSYSLPPTVPFWIGIAGGALAALCAALCRRFFGKNVINGAVVSRLILAVAFSEEMSHYVLDGISMATPLTALRSGEMVDTFSMIVGTTSGTVGETSALILCLCGVVLLLIGVIDYRVPLACLFSFAAVLAVFSGEGLSSYYLTAHLAGGGYMLTLWYLAPDYSTIPLTKSGRWIYGVLLGVLAALLRVYAPMAESISLAVLIANLCTPLIEKATIPTPFGVE